MLSVWLWQCAVLCVVCLSAGAAAAPPRSAEASSFSVVDGAERGDVALHDRSAAKHVGAGPHAQDVSRIALDAAGRVEKLGSARSSRSSDLQALLRREAPPVVATPEDRQAAASGTDSTLQVAGEEASLPEGKLMPGQIPPGLVHVPIHFPPPPGPGPGSGPAVPDPSLPKMPDVSGAKDDELPEKMDELPPEPPGDMYTPEMTDFDRAAIHQAVQALTLEKAHEESLRPETAPPQAPPPQAASGYPPRNGYGYGYPQRSGYGYPPRAGSGYPPRYGYGSQVPGGGDGGEKADYHSSTKLGLGIGIPAGLLLLACCGCGIYIVRTKAEKVRGWLDGKAEPETDSSDDEK